MACRVLLFHLLFVVCLASAGLAWAQSPTGGATAPPPGEAINVRAWGAIGDGLADDTAALQQALDAASGPTAAGEVLIPAGTYRITNTLVIRGKQSLIIRGQGSSKFEPQTKRGALTSLLAWDGPAGGVLLHTIGIGGCEFRNLSLTGVLPQAKPREERAGILYLGSSGAGYGNMINHFSMVTLFNADVGFQMAEKSTEPCASDTYFENVTMVNLGTGFKVLNDQGVNYLFHFLFAVDVDRVFDFQKGGVMSATNVQATCCGVVLDIGGGGRCSGIFTLQGVHLEGAGRLGPTQRWQLLRVNPTWEQVQVCFTGFVDAQWIWARNTTDSRRIPLCEIGPGATVTFQSSIFNSTVARVMGEKGKPAVLVIRESSFGNVLPERDAFSANEYGYLRVTGCRDDNCRSTTNPGSILPDLLKWPDLPVVRIPDAQPFNMDITKQGDKQITRPLPPPPASKPQPAPAPQAPDAAK